MRQRNPGAVRVAPEQRGGRTDLLHRFRIDPRTQFIDPGRARGAVGSRQPDFDQLMGPQGVIELVGDGIGEPALAEPHDRFAAMGLGTEVSNLGTGEHRRDPQDSQAVDEPASVARHARALAAIKRELAAIVIVGALGLPLASIWLDGAREVAVLAGYGLGAALWVHARARGLLYAARGRQRSGGDGS